MIKRAIFAISLCVASASPAAEGVPPAGLDEIMAGTRSCIAATSASGLNTAMLQSDGWRAATMSANGQAVASTLKFYGKGRLIMIVNAAEAKPMCILTAKIANVREFSRIQSSFAADFGAPVKDDGKGEQIFFPPNNHIVDLASTGSQASPSVRIAVGTVEQGSK